MFQKAIHTGHLRASWQVITACPAGPDDADAKVLKAEARSLLEDVEGDPKTTENHQARFF